MSFRQGCTDQKKFKKAGGAFTTIGSASANYLARWNGAAWTQLAGGTNGPINALAWRDGKLYVGGDNPASRIAMWDGTWPTLGDGFNGPVRALALDSNGNLYAAGEFTYAGYLYVNHIARWDGNQWHPLGGGLSGSNYVLALTFDGDGSGTDSNVFALAPVGNRLMVGGAGFWLTVHGTNFSSRSVVRWNGNPLTTTYVSGSQLRVFVPADTIVTPDIVTILVSTPAPNGGGSSFTKTFQVLESYRIFLPAVIR